MWIKEADKLDSSGKPPRLMTYLIKNVFVFSYSFYNFIFFVFDSNAQFNLNEFTISKGKISSLIMKTFSIVIFNNLQFFVSVPRVLHSEIYHWIKNSMPWSVQRQPNHRYVLSTLLHSATAFNSVVWKSSLSIRSCWM